MFEEMENLRVEKVKMFEDADKTDNFKDVEKSEADFIK